MAETIVGLDFGSSYLKAVQGRISEDGVEIERVGAKRLDVGVVRDGALAENESEALSDSIVELWDENGFTAKKVIIGVSGERVLTNEIIVPFMEPDDLKDSLIHQINEKSWLTLDVERAEIDYVVLEDFIDPDDHLRKLRLFIVGVPSDVIEDLSIAVQDAKLTPVGVDLGALAALRSLRVVKRTLQDNTLDAVIDIGADLTVIIFHQGGIPRHIQTTSGSAGHAVTRTMREYVTQTSEEAEEAKKLGGAGNVARVIETSAENISRNIRQVIDFYFSRQPDLYLGGITLIGGTALLQGLQEYIQQDFNNIPVNRGEYDSTYHMLGGSPLFTHAENGGTYFTAAGLITGTQVG
jgi:type IV pilus assembly protein PilM